MKTNLKLSKITISKLDNLNFNALENEQLANVKGGGGDGVPIKFPGSPTVTAPYNDTTHLSSCEYGIGDDGNNDYGNCISRQS
ncbi:hypothetical protein [Flavobacterium sp. ASV13]|uniref:hypothetical protein n=1 Tax=Flavobacterium sp. ASV13 TaxID=1506583 RepID=UPI0005596285|nr:hypothetical protein [Flavobacterium sp. ASV13]